MLGQANAASKRICRSHADTCLLSMALGILDIWQVREELLVVVLSTKMFSFWLVQVVVLLQSLVL